MPPRALAIAAPMALCVAVSLALWASPPAVFSLCRLFRIFCLSRICGATRLFLAVFFLFPPFHFLIYFNSPLCPPVAALGACPLPCACSRVRVLREASQRPSFGSRSLRPGAFAAGSPLSPHAMQNKATATRCTVRHATLSLSHTESLSDESATRSVCAQCSVLCAVYCVLLSALCSVLLATSYWC